jgi:ZU5 domain-containing protein
MKNIIKINHLSIALITLLMTFVLFSCKDNSVTTTNNNNGPQPTPVGTPNGVPVTATIGASGGSMISTDSTVELIIPAGALSSNTDITIQPVTNFCWNSAGNAFRLTPEGQQFQQPVTIKFHYSDTTLAATLGDFMGIAHQDASGYWHYMHDLTNDTVNRVISAPITHFSDWSYWDITHLEPRETSVRVNETVNLRVTYVSPSGDDEFVPLPLPVDQWWVSGGGTIISHQGQTAVYKAPAQVPSQNPVTVGVQIIHSVTYNGHHSDQFLLTSRIRIRPNTHIFDLRLNMVANWGGQAGYPCFLMDGADMVVTVNNSTVTITGLLNQFPNVAPPSGTYPDGSVATWLPGNDVGLINITIAAGSLTTINDIEMIRLNFTHTNTKKPLFRVVPPSGPVYFLGGDPVPGVPSQIYFVNKDSTQNWGDPINYLSATLTPRP